MPRPSYKLSREEFANIWNSCNTVEEVSIKTGMPKASCQSKASILRNKGLTLKMLQRGRKAAVATPTAPLNQTPVEHHNEEVNANNPGDTTPFLGDSHLPPVGGLTNDGGANAA